MEGRHVMVHPTNERRLSGRSDLKYKLTLRSEQNQHLFGTVKNISEKGLHIMTLNGQHKGDEIRLIITLPELLQAIYGKTIEIVASWRWSHPVNEHADTPFYMAGYEYDIEQLENDSRFFIEHVLEGIPEHIIEMS